MAKIYKRQKQHGGKVSTYYVVRFKDGNRQVRDKQFRRRYEAEAFVSELSELLKSGRFSASGNMPFRDLADMFLEASKVGRGGRKPLTRKTLQGYKQYLTRHVLPEIGDIPISEVSRSKLNKLAETLVVNLNRRASARQAFNVVKVCLSYAVDMEFLPMNAAMGLVVRDDPSERVNVCESDNKEEPTFTFTPSEVRRLLDVAKAKRDNHPHGQVREAWKRYYPMFLFLALTGTRASEMRALRWSDFDWDKREVRIRRSADADTCDIGPLKSKHAYREIPLPKELYDEFFQARPVEDGLIFAGKKSKRPPTHSSISYYYWHPLLEEAGVPKVGLHALRHFYATQLLSNNVDLLSVKKWMGHHSASFTIDRYGHYMRDNSGAHIDGIKIVSSNEVGGAGTE